MNNYVKILLIFVGILLTAIGILCYQLGVLDRFFIFLIPMAAIRLAHNLLLIKTYVNND